MVATERLALEEYLDTNLDDQSSGFIQALLCCTLKQRHVASAVQHCVELNSCPCQKWKNHIFVCLAYCSIQQLYRVTETFMSLCCVSLNMTFSETRLRILKTAQPEGMLSLRLSGLRRCWTAQTTWCDDPVCHISIWYQLDSRTKSNKPTTAVFCRLHSSVWSDALHRHPRTFTGLSFGCTHHRPGLCNRLFASFVNCQYSVLNQYTPVTSCYSNTK